MRPVRELILTITCECGQFRDLRLSRVVAEPAVECAGCDLVTIVPETAIAAILHRFGGEDLDLSRWEPRRVDALGASDARGNAEKTRRREDSLS